MSAQYDDRRAKLIGFGMIIGIVISMFVFTLLKAQGD